MADERFTTYDDELKADKRSYSGTDSRIPRGTVERLSDVVNVKDWGATGNGVTNDLAAINAAKNYAATLGQVSHHGAILYFPPGTYWIGNNNTLYLDADTAGLITYKGAGRDATIIRGNCNITEAQQEEQPDSFLCRSSGFGCIRDLTLWNESTSPTSGALFSDACSNNRYIENCHFIGMTGFVCASVGFGYRLTDCIMTCSKPPTLASDANRSPIYSSTRFDNGYRAYGSCTMSGDSVSGFGPIRTVDTHSDLIDPTLGVKFTPNHRFDVVFYIPGFINDNTNDGPTFSRAIGHAIARSDGTITPADIVLDHAGFGYGYTPTYAISHSNIYGGVGAYVGCALVKNCHAYGFDIGFSFLGGATSMKSCSATRCGVGFYCGLLNGSRTFGTLDAEISPGRPFFLYSGDMMSCVTDRCTWGIYCTSAKGLFAANRITGSTGPYDPAAASISNYSGTVAFVDTVAPHNITASTWIQISPASLTDDPNGFVQATPINPTQLGYTKATAPAFGSCTWNYPLEYGINCSVSNGSFFAANTIDAAVSIVSFSGNGGPDGTSVWCTKGEYGWFLPQNNADAYGAGVWRYKSCGGGRNIARPNTVGSFPEIPWIKFFPGQQENMKGASTTGDEINITTCDTSNFGDPLYVFLTLTALANSGENILTFASVPPEVVAGMAVDEWYTHTGTLPIGSIRVDHIDATHVYLTAPITAAIGPGARINFLRNLGSNTYKARFDGVAWKRIA